MRVNIEDLEMDRERKTCRLKDPPPKPKRGRPTKLTPEQVRYGRYMYWSGRSRQAEAIDSWGLTKNAVSDIMNFKTLAWM